MPEANSIEDHAKELRNYAEMTARYSQNWDNFQEIARQMLQATYDAALERGK